jgi:hypothetical protein
LPAIDAVAALSKVLAYNLLRWDEPTFARNLAKFEGNYQRAGAGPAVIMPAIVRSTTKSQI